MLNTVKGPPSRVVGVDLAVRGSHKAVVTDGGRTIGKPFEFCLTPDGVKRLVSRAREGATGREVAVAMEPSGPAWLPLMALLQHEGITTYLIKPQKVHDYRTFRRHHTKSDVTDAETVARVPAADPESLFEAPKVCAELVTLQRLLKRRDRAVEEVVGRKKRLQAVLRMVVPGALEALGSSWDTEGGMAFLGVYLDPERVVAAGPETIAAFWAKHGRVTDTDAVASRVYQAFAKVAELLAPVRRAGRCPHDFDCLQDEVRDELEGIERGERQAKQLYEEIARVHRRYDPQRTLEQLYGVGPLIAAAVDATVGSVARFRNSRAFVSFTGWSPRKKQTGDSDPHQPVTKAGNRLLKKYLFLAADVARQWDPDFAAYYGVRYAQGCHHNLILGALARKMAVRIYALMRRREQHVADGAADAPTYVLRNAQGESISKSEARLLIQTTHARSVVAPERANKAKARKAVPADFAPPKAAEATASAPPPTATTPASMSVSAPTTPTPVSAPVPVSASAPPSTTVTPAPAPQSVSLPTALPPAPAPATEPVTTGTTTGLVAEPDAPHALARWSHDGATKVAAPSLPSRSLKLDSAPGKTPPVPLAGRRHAPSHSASTTHDNVQAVLRASLMRLGTSWGIPVDFLVRPVEKNGV